MDWISLFGYLGAGLTTIAFFPQAIKVHREHETKNLSLGMFFLFTIGVAFWWVYGILLGEWPIILANGITFLLACYIVGMKIKFK